MHCQSLRTTSLILSAQTQTKRSARKLANTKPMGNVFGSVPAASSLSHGSNTEQTQITRLRRRSTFRCEKSLVNDPKALQLAKEFFLIGSVVCFPFEALFRRERLVLAGFCRQPMIGVFKHFCYRLRFLEVFHTPKRGKARVQ